MELTQQPSPARGHYLDVELIHKHLHFKDYAIAMLQLRDLRISMMQNARIEISPSAHNKLMAPLAQTLAAS